MELGLLLFFTGLIPFLYGLFYNFTVFFVTAVLIVIACFTILKNKQIYYKKSVNFYIYSAIVISYLITCIWAVDKEAAFEGFLKHLSCLIVFFILMQLKKDKKKQILELIPYSGAAMCIVSLLLAIIPSTRNAFFTENGRLVGFFQYSNSFALFLLLGFAILINNENKTKTKIALMVILVTGIFLTGSRFTFVIGILYVLFYIFKFLKTKKGKRFAFIAIAISLAVISIIFIFGQNYLRIFRISLNESTLIGRAIYNLDGIKILLKNPFGLGHMGYSYVYPEVQTADYAVKFAHNDLLQQGLDTGIIPMIMLTFLFAYNIFSKKTEKLNRQLLILMFVNLLVDFNMQFAIFEFIFVLLLEQQEAKIIQFKIKSRITSIIICTFAILVFVYFGVR